MTTSAPKLDQTRPRYSRKLRVGELQTLLAAMPGDAIVVLGLEEDEGLCGWSYLDVAEIQPTPEEGVIAWLSGPRQNRKPLTHLQERLLDALGMWGPMTAPEAAMIIAPRVRTWELWKLPRLFLEGVAVTPALEDLVERGLMIRVLPGASAFPRYDVVGICDACRESEDAKPAEASP